MLIQAQIGPQATGQSMAPGNVAALRLGNLGDLIASELHGRYYESVYRRAVFNSSIIGQTTSAGVATTYVGLAVENPIGSNMNLVLLKVGFAFLVAFAAASVLGIMTGYNSATNCTHTAAAVVKSNMIGIGGSGLGLADSSATLPTAPVLNTILGAGLTGAITTVPSIPSEYDLEGSIVLPPGAYAAFYTSTVSAAASFAGSFTWEEVPV